MPESESDLDRFALKRVGRTLRGKLRLDSLLGVGGTAAVYAATHRTGRRYAVKVLHPLLMVDARIRERFFREGYVVNRIEHPGVVGVVDDDVDDDGAIFLVMDLLEGETVDALATRRGARLPVGDVLAIADETLDVLIAAHGLGIVHRDLKPENLFVTKEGAVKVLDFGIARLVELGGRTLTTRSGTVMGTPAFMPPEQARGRLEQVDARTDLWAVGASMFSLLTGRLVHEARTANEILLAAMTAHAPPLRDVMPSVSEDVAHIVDRAVLYDHDSRWPDAATMQQAVRDARRRNPEAIYIKRETLSDDTMPIGHAGEDAITAAFVSPSMKLAIGSDAVNAFSATEVGRPSTVHRTIKDSAPPTVTKTDEVTDEVDAFVRRGSARASSGDLQGALEDFTRALTLDAGCVVAYYDRGVIRHRMGDFEGSLVDYGDALAIAPEIADARYNRALVLRELGRLEPALNEAKAAVRLYAIAGRSSDAENASKLAQVLGASDVLDE